MENSLFTHIIRGEIPCHKVYEDDATLAFLDIHPVQPGHTLVVPKTQVAFVWDLHPEDYQRLLITVQKVALRLRRTLGVPYVGSQIVGVDVPHAHVHLIPFATVSQFRSSPNTQHDPDHEALAAMAKRLNFK